MPAYLLLHPACHLPLLGVINTQDLAAHTEWACPMMEGPLSIPTPPRLEAPLIPTAGTLPSLQAWEAIPMDITNRVSLWARGLQAHLYQGPMMVPQFLSSSPHTSTRDLVSGEWQCRAAWGHMVVKGGLTIMLWPSHTREPPCPPLNGWARASSPPQDLGMVQA